MNQSNHRPLCAVCGDRTGVYERVWQELPDGTMVRTSLLKLSEQATGVEPGLRLHHAGCAPIEISSGQPAERLN